MLNMDGTINRPSDANVSFKHYSPSLCSPMAAPWLILGVRVDRDIIQLDTSHFFRSCSNITGPTLADILMSTCA